MTNGGTLNYAVSMYRGERGGGGGYTDILTESFKIDGVGTVVKSETPNVMNPALRMIGKGCSVPGCGSLIATPDITPAQAAQAFSLHNAVCHDEEHGNHVVYLWMSTDPDE